MNKPWFNSLLNKYPALAKMWEGFRSQKVRDKLALDNKRMLIFVPICLIIIICADIIFITRLQLGALKKLEPKITKLREDLSALDKGLIIMRDFKNKHKETLTRNKKIIPEDQIDYILQELSIIAKNDEVKIIQMKPVKVPQATLASGAAALRYAPLSINLDLVCGYHQLGKFINDLENAEILFAVDSMRITRQGNDYFQQKVSLALKTYVKK